MVSGGSSRLEMASWTTSATLVLWSRVRSRSSFDKKLSLTIAFQLPGCKGHEPILQQHRLCLLVSLQRLCDVVKRKGLLFLVGIGFFSNPLIVIQHLVVEVVSSWKVSVLWS